MKTVPFQPCWAIRVAPASVPEIACGSKEFNPPFPFPPRASRGGVGSPHAGEHAARQQKQLARIDAAGSPHKRAAAPLCIPCERARDGLSDLHNRRFQTVEVGRNRPTIENRLHKKLDTTLDRDGLLMEAATARERNNPSSFSQPRK